MLGGYLAFLLIGAAGTFYGPALVYIAAETNEPVANLGILFVLHWSGFFASTSCANYLGRRLGIRRTVGLSCLLVAVGVMGLIALPFPYNLAFTLLIGFGAGTLEVMLNRSVEFLAKNAPAAALLRMHAALGVGSAAMPLGISGVVWLGLNWHAAGVGLILLAACTGAVVWRWREFTVPQGTGLTWRFFPWRSIVLFVLMIVIFVGVETAVGGWVTTFFTKLGQGAFLGAFATSLFFLTFTVGRVLLASIPERFGYPRIIQVSMLLGAGALTLALISGLAVIGFGLAGFAFSLVFPTLVAWAARRHPEIRAQMVSVSIASAGVGGIVIPYTVGLGVGSLGVWSLPPMLIATTVLVALLALFEPAPDAVIKPTLVMEEYKEGGLTVR